MQNNFRHIAHTLLTACMTVLCCLPAACRHENPPNISTFNFELSNFQYPASKYWAHGVNDVELARMKAPFFEGLEADINYSTFQDQLFMGHEEEDTLRGLTFDRWIDSLPHPENHCLWLDLKNITFDNAPRIAHRILAAARRHNIADRIMVESWDQYALLILKDSGLHVILWVDNPYWTGHSERVFRDSTQAQIDYLHPDALSGDYHNFPRLPEAFPNQNIHIWDTPRANNDTNCAHSQSIAAHPSVKVVLVDYPTPPKPVIP